MPRQDTECCFILVEVEGGTVRSVQAQGVLPCAMRVLVRDYDQERLDSEARDEEWRLPGMDDPALTLNHLNDSELLRLGQMVSAALKCRRIKKGVILLPREIAALAKAS
jgi:hypothetical protein